MSTFLELLVQVEVNHKSFDALEESIENFMGERDTIVLD